jgi:hypothetical protein
MTRADAEQAFQTIATIYDLHPERAGEQATVWVPMLEGHDGEVVASILLRWIDGAQPDRFPKVGGFAAFVRDVERQRDKDTRPRQLISGDHLRKPVWVVAWDLLRARGERRAMPEMEGGARQLGHGWPPDEGIVDEETYRAVMKEAAEVPQDARSPIYEPEVDCPVCIDTGWVEVGERLYVWRGKIRHGVEQMGPCPACSKGKLVEHPLDRQGPWGPNGYWQGQAWRPVRSGVVEAAA